MKKHILDLQVSSNSHIGAGNNLLKLTSQVPLPEMLPGQFAQVLINNASPSVFLRRPISIHFFDRTNNELWLLVHVIGAGTQALSEIAPGSVINLVAPLGNQFTIPMSSDNSAPLLLIGGGVGVAPLLFLGAELRRRGFEPLFLLGAKTGEGLVQLKEFEKYGTVYITTEDGSLGEIGLVLHHPVLKKNRFGRVYTCGPKGMMVAVAKYTNDYSIPCEASLENLMACGIGACLCCIEDTTRGYKCVCSEGPVFNIAKLKWLI